MQDFSPLLLCLPLHQLHSSWLIGLLLNGPTPSCLCQFLEAVSVLPVLLTLERLHHLEQPFPIEEHCLHKQNKSYVVWFSQKSWRTPSCTIQVGQSLPLVSRVFSKSSWFWIRFFWSSNSIRFFVLSCCDLNAKKHTINNLLYCAHMGRSD